MDTKRPKLSIPLTPTDISAEVLALAALVCSAVIRFLIVPKLANVIPTHFDASGAADLWGPKTTIYPLFYIVIWTYVGLTILSRFPHFFNYPWPITEENAQAQYRIARSMMIWMKAEILLTLTYSTWGISRVSMGVSNSLGLWFIPVFLVVLFGTTAFHIFKLYKAR
jgi:uncharacterized membrane protein